VIDTAKAANLWACLLDYSVDRIDFALGSLFTRMLTSWTSSMPQLVCRRPRL